ncbi:hypothetical protein VH570_06440 [Sphingobium sp. HT1-2]|jgi:hypothetical protein|uniref:hypothetical protein n=1 Tax=Sphingobium sp. HT1-2 TaxID=3111640 RepID=UPI003BFF50D5
MRFIVATVLVFLNTSASGALPTVDSKWVDGWISSRVESDALGVQCSITKKFPDKTEIVIEMVPSGAGTLRFTNEDWKSLANAADTNSRGDMTLPVRIEFGDEQPKELLETFNVFVSQYAVRPPSIYKHFTRDSFMAMAKDFAETSTVHVYHSGWRKVGTWSVTGAKAATVSLMSCVRDELVKTQQQQANDPFRDQ